MLTYQTDLETFHAAHFSTPLIDYFAQHFLGPAGEDLTKEADDNLGYYEDGIKRTLTDEQIAIFRHSEIQALLRDRRYADDAKRDDDGGHEIVGQENIEPGRRALEIDDANEEPHRLSSAHDSSMKKRHKGGRRLRKSEQARQKGWYKEKVKPDLRKRTWDKVDSGVGNLDYDEGNVAAQLQNSASQRRRISYDD